MSVGIGSIDDQHRKLFSMFNDLHTASVHGKGAEVIGDTLKGLIQYTVEHFKYEEKLFQETKYPEAREHADEHAVLAKKVIDIQAKFRFGASEALSEETLFLLVKWLMDHTMSSDKKYSQHLIAAGIK